MVLVKSKQNYSSFKGEMLYRTKLLLLPMTVFEELAEKQNLTILHIWYVVHMNMYDLAVCNTTNPLINLSHPHCMAQHVCLYNSAPSSLCKSLFSFICAFMHSNASSALTHRSNYN